VKVPLLVAVSVLIALPAEAHRQNNVLPICNNDGRCTTLSVTAPTSSRASSLRERRTGTSERKTHRVIDANGNSMLVTVQTVYGFNITVHPAYASKFLKGVAARYSVGLASRGFVGGDPLCRGGYTGLEPANPNEEALPR
jgi:hypothetical protein